MQSGNSMIECVVWADKKTHGKIPTALKTCISQLIEHLHIYHVMSPSKQPCEIQIISLSQVRTKHWSSGLPHVTESCSKVVSMQTQTEIFASTSYFCSDSLPLRTPAAQHRSDCFSQDLSYLVPFCPKQPAGVPASVQLMVSLTNCRGGFQQLQSIPPPPLPSEDQGSPCSGDRELDSLMKTLPLKTHNYPFFSCSNFCTISQRKAEIWVTFKPFGHFKFWSGRSTEISGTLLLSAYYLFHFPKLPYDRWSNHLFIAVNKYLMSTY